MTGQRQPENSSYYDKTQDCEPSGRAVLLGSLSLLLSARVPSSSKVSYFVTPPPVFSCGPRAQNRLTFKNCNPIIIIIIIIKRKNEICDKCKRTEIQASVPVSIVSSELDLCSLASAYCQWLLLCTGSELSSWERDQLSGHWVTGLLQEIFTDCWRGGSTAQKRASGGESRIWC